LYYDRGATFSKDMKIAVAAANTLGGSTAVYTGVSFRPPREVLKKWREEFGLDFLTDSYVKRTLDKIEKEIHVQTLDEKWDNDNNRLFAQGCRKLGIEPKRLRINIKNCKEQGFCNLGCTSGAKQSTLEVQIPKALKAGADLKCNTTVQGIRENEVFAIHASGEKVSFRGKKIVVAAGALRSPILLQNSAKELGIKNSNLGRYLTLHPAYNLHAVHSQVLKNYRGFPKTYYVDNFSETDHFYLETSFYYPGVTAKNIPGFGQEHFSLMQDYNKMMSILILYHDLPSKKARVYAKKGKLVLCYPIDSRLKKAMAKAIRQSVRIFFAAGAQQLKVPMSQGRLLTPKDEPYLEKLIQEKYFDAAKEPLSSAHPQGGCRMSSLQKRGVCTVEGRVYGTNHVYVADASLFPTSVHVNPYETVMLLANYVAEVVASEV
ncbi:MAG: hypothetical protein D6767_02510, partial [Candidatus Hydrogenedentota bacterium]